MKNGWTAGAYTLFRAVFGCYLFVHFVQLAPYAAEVFSSSGVLPRGSASPILHLFPNLLAAWDSPSAVVTIAALGAGLSLLLVAGIADRAAAVALWYFWACLLGRNPLIANPSIPYVGWMLLAHAVLPRARFLDWLARGRLTGDRPWRMAPTIHAAAWIIMALGYSYSGYMKLLSPSWQEGTALLNMLSNPLGRSGPVHGILEHLPPLALRLATWGALLLELLFAPLSLLRRIRPWLWLLLLFMHLVLIVVIDFADLSLGMVMLHLFTFDPSWIRPRGRGEPGTVFYDGQCAFCHGFVRFVLSEEPEGVAFRFAPLSTGDTIVVRTGDGVELTRSDALLHILGRLGGIWRLMGGVARLVPRPLRDGAYGIFASVRRRLFAHPDQACPVMPPALRARFVDA